MKCETNIHQHPLTPPNVHVDLHNDIHELAQYNADFGFPYDEVHEYGDGYSSPCSTLHDSFSQHSSRIGSHSEAFGLGPHYDGYSQGTGFYQQGQHNDYAGSHAMFSGSPPTPRSATEDEVGQRTRSSQTLSPSSSPQHEERPKLRPKPAPKAKKGKAGKVDKPKMPKLMVPLSVLTKDLVNVPIRNMEEWVNRSAETRRKEVEKRNGYVTRPMNSFMLYRSAYAERTKQWSVQNNHQVVSSVSGESWPLEPPAIRELYNEYAKVERINHQNAHPTYKFSPSKTVAPPRKRKGEFSDDEPSDLDDVDWSPGQGRSRQRLSRRADRDVGYPTNMNGEYFDRSFGPNSNRMNKSSWEMSNEGRPMHLSVGHEDMYNQYFQTSMHPNMSLNHDGIEDMRLRSIDTPEPLLHFSPDHALLGLPGGNAGHLMHELHSHASTPLGGEAQIDPMLYPFDDGNHHGVMVEHPQFWNGHMSIMERELD